MALAVMSGVRALRRQPVTVALSAAVLAMISNLAVNEPRNLVPMFALVPVGGRG
jgi:hypothetical protein